MVTAARASKIAEGGYVLIMGRLSLFTVDRRYADTQETLVTITLSQSHEATFIVLSSK